MRLLVLLGALLCTTACRLNDNANPSADVATETPQTPQPEEVDAALTQDWPDLQRYANANAELVSGPNERRVVFMGNSILEAWRAMVPDFWREHPNYVVRGISGQTTPQMLLRFRQDVIDLKPEAVVILAGINDIAHNTGPMTVEQTFGNIASMAELATAAEIDVVIASTLPAYDFPWRPGMAPAQKVVKLNGYLRDYAAERGHTYLDYFSAMADARPGLREGLHRDEVHPTAEGYAVMAPLTVEAVERALAK